MFATWGGRQQPIERCLCHWHLLSQPGDLAHAIFIEPDLQRALITPFDSAAQKSNTNVDGLVKVASVPGAAGSSQSLWVLDYRPVKAKIDSALTIQNWGGQVALQPMVTAPINADSWYNHGKIYDGLWGKRMRYFADRNASVTAYLNMKPGSNGQKDTLMLGIPQISIITPFLLEAQSL